MAKQPVLMKWNTLTRNMRNLKLKLIFTLILPAAIILLTIKIIQTFLRIKLRAALTPEIPKKPVVVTPVPSKPVQECALDEIILTEI